jgi:hypothetical protein
VEVIQTLFKVSGLTPKRIVSVKHLKRRRIAERNFIKADTKEWLKRYRRMLKARGISIDEETAIVIRMNVQDRLSDHYNLKFDEALEVVGLSKDDWKFINRSHDEGHRVYLRELLKFPVLHDQDDDDSY